MEKAFNFQILTRLFWKKIFVKILTFFCQNTHFLLSKYSLSFVKILTFFCQNTHPCHQYAGFLLSKYSLLSPITGFLLSKYSFQQLGPSEVHAPRRPGLLGMANMLFHCAMRSRSPHSISRDFCHNTHFSCEMVIHRFLKY